MSEPNAVVSNAAMREKSESAEPVMSEIEGPRRRGKNRYLRLIDEIEAIEDKVDPLTWKAIDAVRSVGNIGAHMEKDINVIVDVDPDEAAQLISLIEILIKDWYITR